ncbi:MAG: MBL fold metallo-hydrolase [Anaerolineales bacterium]|nr:MBL fold metallo-hydrolase [Anaerolineales bacterium]
MSTKLLKYEVGPWPMNTYLLQCENTGLCAIIDPGADPEILLENAAGARIDKILITHGHPDHVGALDIVKTATGAPVHLHPSDAETFELDYDVLLSDGDLLEIGDLRIRVVHTPGHTLGQCCFVIDHRIVVGDTIFVGGPGKTWSAEDFSTTMETMQNIVFRWPDETEFYPGHGPSGKIGDERPAFEAFVARGWPEDLHGDVTWLET